jgi:hypothetical protein
MLFAVQTNRILAPGLLDAWNNPEKFEQKGAWLQVDWYGSIKPSTKLIDQAKGSEMLVKNGWSTRAREARTITGTKFSKNIKRLKQENEQLAEVLEPLVELTQTDTETEPPTIDE